MPDSIDAVLRAWQDISRQQHDRQDEIPADSLLYAGNLHDSVPRQLVFDPLLSPRDKLAWQILRLYATQPNVVSFPSYSDLQKLLAGCPAMECASRSTVSHCLIMLRLTRWLSLCQRSRDPQTGRILGNIYALHDKQLSLNDARRLDSRYLQLLDDCTRHPSKSLRLVAQALQQTMHDDPALRDLASRFEHADALPRIPQHVAESSHSTRDAPGTQRGLSQKATKSENEIAAYSVSCPLVLNQDPGHVLNTVKRKKSSTQVQWPEYLPLTESQRGAVWRAMSDLPDQLCQEVLDNCSHRIATGDISNPLGYILATLVKAKRGEFNLFKRPKKVRPRGSSTPGQERRSDLIENLKYLCQQHKKHR